jgi:hypothetical protein
MSPSSLLRIIEEMFPPGRHKPKQEASQHNASKEGYDTADVDAGTIAGKAFARRFVKVDPMPKDRMTTTPVVTIGSARAST